MSKKATAYPDNWLEKKLGDICLIEIGGTPSRNNPNFWAENEEGYPWVAISDLGSKWVYHTAEQITRSGVTSSNVKLVPKGTVLMSFKLTLGRVGVQAGVDLYSNEAIAAFFPRSSDVFSGWLYHTLPSIAQSGSAEQAIKGQTLNKDKLERLCFRLPPLPEQRRIAEILDTMDEAIARTESLITKLKQMKAGLLHDLLTRGLDENGELRDAIAHPEQFKDSPLGQIPKDWEVVTVADIAIDVTDGDHHTPERSDSGVFLLSARNVLNGYLALEDVDFVPEHEYQRMIRRCYPEPGDILISCSGTIGRVCEVPADFRGVLVRSAALVKLERTRCQSRFIEAEFQSDTVQTQILMEQLQAAQPNLFQGSIKRLSFPLPPLYEQERISEILDTHNTRIRKEEAYRDKLKLQKKGLMHDLLTGKVRVNGAELAKEDTSQLAALTTA